MAASAFGSSLEFVLKWEGGYVDHPKDPGGATNKGVTKKVYDKWRTDQGLPTRDVRELSDDELHAIYESGYWRPSRCDVLRSPLDLAQFDTAVNMGVKRAVLFVQTAVGADADGAFGSGTEQCAANCDLGEALVKYCDTREAFYDSLIQKNADLGVFRKGWMNRLNALRKTLGLPGFESADDTIDFGDTGYVAKVPDIGEKADID